MIKQQAKNNLNILSKTAIFLIVALFSIFTPNETHAQQNLTAECSVSPLAITVGESATWEVEVSGGNGTYAYYWTGSENLIGNSSSVTKFYSRPGTQSATVTVYSDGQTVTPTCNLIVQENIQTLSGSCSTQSSILRESDNVVWSANVFGGNGSYQYFWTGSDELQGSGQSISRVYNFPGRKNATVVITSDGKSTVRECSVTIEPDPELEGECFADSNSINSGNAVTWTAQASGGTGEYRYSWYGDNLRGSSEQAISQVYEGAGERIANVEITSGSQSITRICSVEVRSGGQVLGASSENPPASPSRSTQGGEGPIPNEEEEDEGFSFIGWKILSTIVLLIGAAIFSGMIVYFKKQAKQEEEEQILAGPGESPLKDIADIIQSEAHKREVIISAGAIKILMEKTHNSITEGVIQLHNIIDELKKTTETIVVDGVSPAVAVPADESRWLVIDELMVEKYFLTNKS